MKVSAGVIEGAIYFRNLGVIWSGLQVFFKCSGYLVVSLLLFPR